MKPSICTIFVLFYCVSALALNRPSAVLDTGKTSNEAEAAYDDRKQYQQRFFKSKRKQQVSVRKKRTKKHLGQRQHFSWKPKKQREFGVIWYILLGLFVLSLLVGLGLVIKFLSLFWSTLFLGLITLAALAIPFIEDIEKGFFEGLTMFVFGYFMGRITLFSLGFWIANASLISSGSFIILGSLAALALTLVFVEAIKILWKAIRSIFRLFVLLLTFGLVDIDK